MKIVRDTHFSHKGGFWLKWVSRAATLGGHPF